MGPIIIAIAAIAAPGGQDRAAPVGFAGSPAEAFGPDEYPPEARVAREQGRVVVKVAVAADGRPTACVVTEHRSPSLDAKTCQQAMTRVQYTPARDSKGKPITGLITLPVRWQLAQPGFIPAGPIEVTRASFPNPTIETEVTLDEAGRVVSCRVVQGATVGSDPCGGYPVGRQVTPGFVRNGKPIRAVLREVHSFRTEFLP